MHELLLSLVTCNTVLRLYLVTVIVNCACSVASVCETLALAVTSHLRDTHSAGARDYLTHTHTHTHMSENRLGPEPVDP